ncbi:hypothetical protein [Leptodesmis sp.]|uniref:hypothetical protein n=1 Tax=Leptodesmis sp. TaxID=3100501 RepID=UPI00405352A1
MMQPQFQPALPTRLVGWAKPSVPILRSPKGLMGTAMPFAHPTVSAIILVVRVFAIADVEALPLSKASSFSK